MITQEASVMVPVLSNTNQPLMPCHPARARELIKKGRAQARWFCNLYCIKLLDRKEGEKQKVICGIDPGTKGGAISLVSKAHTYINVLSDAVTWVSLALKNRSKLRNSRRRSCPCRKSVFHKPSEIPPSIRSRWDAELRVIRFLLKMYPITDYVCKNNKIRTIKNKSNRSFDKMSRGKNYFFEHLRKLGPLTFYGYDTKNLRIALNLQKIRNQENNFYSHNVNSWVLANYIAKRNRVDVTQILHIMPLQFHRRQLFRQQPIKGGIYHRYGGTVRYGLRKGSLIKYKDKLYFVDSFEGVNKVSISNIKTRKVTNRAADPNKCEHIAFQYIRTEFIKQKKTKTKQKTINNSEKDKKEKAFSVRLPLTIYNKLIEVSKREKISLSYATRVALEKLLQKEE